MLLIDRCTQPMEWITVWGVLGVRGGGRVNNGGSGADGGANGGGGGGC